MIAMRKTKAWATTPDAVASLGCGAKRLAAKSATQFSTLAVMKRMVRLRQLLRAERLCKLRQGDVLIQLIDRHGLRAIDIARQTKQRPNDLSQMYQTCRMFPPRCRRRDVPYNSYFLAMRMVRKFKGLQLQPSEVLAEICRLRFTQHRAVTAHFSAKARRVGNGHAIQLAGTTAPLQLFNEAHHTRFQTLLDRVPDGSIKVLHVDPPYIYSNSVDGRYAGGSARHKTCDSSTAIESIVLVTSLLRDWQCKLKPGGVLLLWQASGPLHRTIAGAIEHCKWALERVVIWDKGRPQAGDFASAYSTQTEWVWVLKRPGDRLVNHNGSSRSDIVRFSPVSIPSLADAQEHAFEKPLDLCKFLVAKHSHEQELVFDCCGCTAAMSVAAIETNRQWVYAESNLANYQYGSGRIRRSLRQLQPAAG